MRCRLWVKASKRRSIYGSFIYIYIWVFDIQAYRCAIIKLQFVEYEEKNRVTLVSIVDLETPIRGCSNLLRSVTLINDINQLLHQLLNIRSRIYTFLGNKINVFFSFFRSGQTWLQLQQQKLRAKKGLPTSPQNEEYFERRVHTDIRSRPLRWDCV